MLETHELSVGYHLGNKDNKLLEGLNISLQSGDLIALMGRNGSGKSSLLRTMVGLNKPLSGNITIDGMDVAAMAASARATKVSLVLTNHRPFARMHVRELVALGRYPHTNFLGKMKAEDLERVNWALEITHLSSLGERNLEEISDGERQKVKIAQAIAQDTPFLVLDEPTAYLDLVNRVELVQLLKELSKSLNKGIVFSTHDLQLALQHCNALWVIDGQGKLSSGAVDVLLNEGVIANAFQAKGMAFDADTLSFRPK